MWVRLGLQPLDEPDCCVHSWKSDSTQHNKALLRTKHPKSDWTESYVWSRLMGFLFCTACWCGWWQQTASNWHREKVGRCCWWCCRVKLHLKKETTMAAKVSWSKHKPAASLLCWTTVHFQPVLDGFLVQYMHIFKSSKLFLSLSVWAQTKTSANRCSRCSCPSSFEAAELQQEPALPDRKEKIIQVLATALRSQGWEKYLAT